MSHKKVISMDRTFSICKVGIEKATALVKIESDGGATA